MTSLLSIRHWQGLRAALVAFAALASPALQAASGDAHVHGTAALRIAVEGPQLVVELESPLANLLGFEHAPRTDAQRAAVRAMADKLRLPQVLLKPSAGASCVAGGVEINAPTLPPEWLGNPVPAAQTAAGKAGGEHADLAATYRWRCEAPAQLRGLEVGLVQAFPGLRRIDVQVAGPKGQSAAVLTGAMRSVAW